MINAISEIIIDSAINCATRLKRFDPTLLRIPTSRARRSDLAVDRFMKLIHAMMMIKTAIRLNNLKNNIDQIFLESKNRYYFEKEVEDRLEQVPFEAVCDRCGSSVDNRVGIMKWHDDKKPATPEDWNLLEKFNDFLGIPVRWLTYCTNQKCGKMWKEGKLENEVAAPKIKIIKDKIRNDIKREKGIT